MKKRIFIFSKMRHPPHTHNHHDVTSFLNERLPNRWIGRRGFVEYPPRSPNLTPLDFFLWGYLKDKVYALKPTIIAELRATTESECMQIPRELLHDVCYSITSRYRRCLDQNGHQFEKQQWQNDKDVVKFFYMLKMKQIIKTWFAVIWSVYTSFWDTLYIYIYIYIYIFFKKKTKDRLL